MDKHTAGPWYITASSPYGIVYGADHTLIVPHYPIGYTTEQQWANARLTASAPELLEALKEVLELASQPHELCTDDYCEADGEFRDGVTYSNCNTLEKAVQLIDKVEGSE